MNGYRCFARAAKRLYAFLHPHWTMRQAGPPRGPAVYLVHHQNMYGPIHAMGLLPGEAKLWVYHSFLQRKLCFAQFYHYTFLQRFRWPKVPAFLVAGLLSALIPPFLRGFGVVPVARGKGSIGTLRQSLKALQAGQSILLCPDVDYANASEEMGEIYTGFLALERMYYGQTGRHLAFVPLALRAEQKCLYAGEAIYFRDGKNPKRERRLVARQLSWAMNTLGQTKRPAPVFVPEASRGNVYLGADEAPVRLGALGQTDTRMSL